MPETSELPSTRITVVRASELDDVSAAESWLGELTRSPEARDGFVAEALRLVNFALHAHRVATLDPFANEIGPHDPVATRIGYGDGTELAEGRWTKAVDAPPDPGRRSRRAEALRPQERFAAVLGGREELGAAEALVLRSRLDVDGGRRREAALQLEPAVRALLAEVGPDVSSEQEEDVRELDERRRRLAELSKRAPAEELGGSEAEYLAETLELAERVLRRRRILDE